MQFFNSANKSSNNTKKEIKIPQNVSRFPLKPL